MLVDDLDHPVGLVHPPQRLVCLVPSLTEALATTVPNRLIGATDWCTHPAGLDVARVRGTKNPDLRAIAALRPDVVIANQEENRQLDVDRLRAAGIPVWVTVIESVDAALRSMRRLFTDLLMTDEPDWLQAAAKEWARPDVLPPIGVLVPVWRDPWMVVGSRTFAGDILKGLGLINVFATSSDRYPRLALSELGAASADLVLLPDEPYLFTTDDGPEMFPGIPVALVSGRTLTWYGPSLSNARSELLKQIRPLITKD